MLWPMPVAIRAVPRKAFRALRFLAASGVSPASRVHEVAGCSAAWAMRLLPEQCLVPKQDARPHHIFGRSRSRERIAPRGGREGLPEQAGEDPLDAPQRARLAFRDIAPGMGEYVVVDVGCPLRDAADVEQFDGLLTTCFAHASGDDGVAQQPEDGCRIFFRIACHDARHAVLYQFELGVVAQLGTVIIKY